MLKKTLIIGASLAFAAAIAGAGLAFADPASSQPTSAQGWTGYAMMGPGMGGYGMMGSGRGGYGMMRYGMMGPGMMGYGMMNGFGARMMGWRGAAGADLHLSTNDVKGYLERWVDGNPHLRVGSVKETDKNTIMATIVTADNGGVVQRFSVDRNTGYWQPLP